jgi:hypothetical protein
MRSLAMRITRLLVAFALAFGTVGFHPTGLNPTPSACPRVEFLGLHGLNEGASGGLPNADHWGPTIQDVWANFRTSGVVEAHAVDYPRLTVSDNDLLGSFQILPAADHAAKVLKNQILSIRYYCASTRIVIAGFSQGAWSVDRAIRELGTSPNLFERLALRSVAGIFLMGDPAWPFDAPVKDRAGLATLHHLGYMTKKDYLNNEVSQNRFQSICLALSDGRFDPICMSHKHETRQMWKREKPVHYLYPTYAVTKRGADFLAGLVK